MAFALGLNLTVARMASVVGGIIIPILINHDNDLIDSTVEVGFGLCIFSLCAGLALVVIDSYADKQDRRELTLSAEDKF